MGHDRLICTLLVSARPVVIKIIEKPPGLVLLGVHSGKSDQSARVVPGIDHLWLNANRRAAEVCRYVQLGDIKSQRIQPANPALDAMHLTGIELLNSSQLVPQVAVPVLGG